MAGSSGLSRGTVTLGKWARDSATRDPDLAARPLWRAIAAEIDTYRDGDHLVDRTPGPEDVPLFDTPG